MSFKVGDWVCDSYDDVAREVLSEPVGTPEGNVYMVRTKGQKFPFLAYEKQLALVRDKFSVETMETSNSIIVKVTKNRDSINAKLLHCFEIAILSYKENGVEKVWLPCMGSWAVRTKEELCSEERREMSIS